MFFSSDEEYIVDDDYDPYAERIEYCKYGSKINLVSGWCCVRCFEDSKIDKPSWNYCDLFIKLKNSYDNIISAY